MATNGVTKGDAPIQNAAPEAASNGAYGASLKNPEPNSTKPAHKYDPNFTQLVIDTMGPKTSERNRVVFASLIRHLHDFAREVELTIPEWMAGVNFINAVGQISTATRNEAHRISDILGLESCVRD
jgi:catechol 1,2-dioxygenase